MTERELQKPWGRLIDQSRKRAGLSVRKAASAAGISEGRWRQIVNGYQSAGGGQTITVEGPDDTVARMAEVAGVTPDALRESGRARAAQVLEGILTPISPELGDEASRIVEDDARRAASRLHRRAALREIEGRMLYMAAKLQAAGHEALDWALDSDGLLEMVARSRGRR
jgi:transcriptional regulator with XRE-family HTH domain